MAGTWIGLAFMPVQRAHSRAYLAVILGRRPRLIEVWRHFFAFAEFLMLKLRVGRGVPMRCEFVAVNPVDFKTLDETDRPALFGTFHFGCSDLLGYLLGARGRSVSIIRLRVDNSDDTRWLGQRFSDKVSFLWVNDPANLLFDIKAAIEAGKHVFAEKPLAVDAPGIRSVLASAHLAKQKNLALQVGFCWRYAEAEKATFERINQGAVGDIVTVHSTYHTGTLSARPRQPQWSEMEFQLRNWWHFAWVSGDHIVEQAVHSIDRLAWALGDRLPLRCNALGGRAARTGEESGHAFDHFAVVYEYEGGRRCFHTCRQIDGCPSDNTDYIYGTKGSCTVNGWTPLHTIKDLAGKELWKYEGPKRDMYQNEHDALFASIRAGTPINDCERGANSTLMAIMGRMAAYTGQTITWEQAMNSQEDLSPARYEFSDLPKPPVAVPGKTKFV